MLKDTHKIQQQRMKKNRYTDEMSKLVVNVMICFFFFFLFIYIILYYYIVTCNIISLHSKTLTQSVRNEIS